MCEFETYGYCDECENECYLDDSFCKSWKCLLCSTPHDSQKVFQLSINHKKLYEWISLVDYILTRELGIKINEKNLIALIKSYDRNFDENTFYSYQKIGNKNYFLVGEWNENKNHDNIEFDEDYGGIVYLENGKIKLLLDNNTIKLISKKTHEVLYIN